MKESKAMTIRLGRDQADALEMVAAVDSQPIAEVIRSAIAEHIDARRADAEFQEGLTRHLSRAMDLLSGQSEADSPST